MVFAEARAFIAEVKSWANSGLIDWQVLSPPEGRDAVCFTGRRESAVITVASFARLPGEPLGYDGMAVSKGGLLVHLKPEDSKFLHAKAVASQAPL